MDGDHRRLAAPALAGTGDELRNRGMFFSSITVPRVALLAARFEAEPLRVIVVISVALVLWSLALTTPTALRGGNPLAIDLAVHAAVIAVVIGLAVFPGCQLWLAVVLFTLAFGVSLLVQAALVPGYLPDNAAQLIAAGYVLNLAIGTLAGLAGRFVLWRLMESAGRRSAEVAMAITVTAAYAAFAPPLALWFVTAMVDPSPPGAFGDVLGLSEHAAAAMMRGYRGALACGVVLFIFLDPPVRRDLVCAARLLPVFLLLAVLSLAGVSLHPALDVTVAAICISLLFPVKASILASAIGIPLYAGLTGAMVDLSPPANAQGAILEIYSVIALALLLMVLVLRFRSRQRILMQRETMSRLFRIQDFAQIGLFVVDVAQGQIQLDPTGRKLLGVAVSACPLGALRRRLHPGDLRQLTEVMRVAGPEPRSLTLRFQRDPLGAPGDYAFIKLFVWYEVVAGGRTYAYGLLLDTTTDMRRECELRRVLAELSDRQGRQTQMFSIISHELRTPAAIMSMLIDEVDSGTPWPEAAPRLRSVTEQLLSILADMRQAVRPEENLPIRWETFSPQMLAETVRNTFALMADPRGIEITLQMPAEAAAQRVTDKVRLNQALSNLVKNAIIHSGCDRIVISYSERLEGEEGLSGVWTVSDNGCGIPAEEVPTLFQPFSRTVRGSRSAADGTGLGLFVVKSAAESLGGRLEFLETLRGATFRLILPLALPYETSPTPPRSGPHDFRNMRVLLVEDNPMVGEITCLRLGKMFKSVTWARNGSEGLLRAAAERPDVIITDLFMPELGGDEMIAELRRRRVNVPIIGLTAAMVGEDSRRLERAGADAILEKPVSQAQMSEILSAVIAARARQVRPAEQEQLREAAAE
ncbi:hybrid sensor histidine kinase/response regulator [Plastorhodobacter daqingensis]|uniref:histidine kinase n=1 Tax=Plastorhodobacter daqingensis TaxID=1387281 RepID=A0ABW2UNZ7_9RHOB